MTAATNAAGAAASPAPPRINPMTYSEHAERFRRLTNALDDNLRWLDAAANVLALPADQVPNEVTAAQAAAMELQPLRGTIIELEQQYQRLLEAAYGH